MAPILANTPENNTRWIKLYHYFSWPNASKMFWMSSSGVPARLARKFSNCGACPLSFSPKNWWSGKLKKFMRYSTFTRIRWRSRASQRIHTLWIWDRPFWCFGRDTASTRSSSTSKWKALCWNTSEIKNWSTFLLSKSISTMLLLICSQTRQSCPSNHLTQSTTFNVKSMSF